MMQKLARFKISRFIFFCWPKSGQKAGIVLLPFFLSQIIGCALPAYNVLEEAGADYDVVSTGYFKHLVSIRHDDHKNGVVVVYIEGDGLPWVSRTRVSYEPTADNPLLLNWFVGVEMPSMYLGRPCYFDLNDEHCSAYWYTHGRYSNDVVDSMVRAVENVLPERPLILVGHSGGGTIAMLIAERLDYVKAVVTIAGNLQVQEWIAHHKYSALKGSLDPSEGAVLDDGVSQMHFYSTDDEVIKSEWITSFAAGQPHAKVTEFPVVGHSVGWNAYRSDIMGYLDELARELDRIESRN